ncbi:MAG: helix-turn-helix domain-containing protein [Desulfurococcaceae archaeon]
MTNEELDEAEKSIYLYLLQRKKPMGVREIAKDLDLPTSTVHYNLKKLLNKGIVGRSIEGYFIKRHVNIEGFVIIGYKLVPRLLVYSAFFAGSTMGCVILILLYGLTLERLLLLLISSIAFSLMFIEGYLARKTLFEKH